MVRQTDIATRALVVTLKAPCSGKTSTEVAGLAGISSRQVDRIYARAIERGFDPNLRPIVIKDAYLKDAPRSGRPSKQTAENQEAILKKIKLDRYGREKTCGMLTRELTEAGIPISGPTVWRILKKAGFRKTKPTRKPGLTQKMRDKRLR